MDVRVGLWRKPSAEIDAFELWCWRRLLRAPWIARRSDQAIVKEISHGCSLEGLNLKLKLQYFGPLMQRADSLEKPLMLERLRSGGEGDNRGWDSWMASVTQWTWVWVDSRSWWWTGRPGMLRFTGSQRVRHDWPTQLNWTQYMLKLLLFCYSKTNTTSVGGRHSWFPFVREVCFLSNCPSCWGFLKLLNIRGAISFFEHSKSKSNHFWKRLRLLWQ